MSLTSNPNFIAVLSHANAMLEHGRGKVDGAPCPLFAGVIDVADKQPVTAQTPPPPGIRIGDFNWCGNNLLHELPFLEALNTLTRLISDKRYENAVEAIYPYYLTNCPDAVTGLFPWGEHGQWSFSDKQALPCSFTDGLKHFLKDRYMIHEHHFFAGAWFWDGMYKHNPEAVVRFAKGLDYHIVDRETFEHNRHAPMNGIGWREGDPAAALGAGKDFARHAGFYIFDCLYVFKKTADRTLLDWARRKTAYHMDRRLPSGLIRGPIRSKAYEAEGQHDSFALCLSDAANVLGDCAEGREFAGYATELFEAKRRAVVPVELPEVIDERIWADGYFRKPCYPMMRGSLMLDMYNRTGAQTYADNLVNTSAWLAKVLMPPPAGIPVLARRYEFFIDLGVNAYLITSDPLHLKMAERVAAWARRDLLHNGFLIGCSNLKLIWKRANGEWHNDPWVTPSTPGMYYSCTGTPMLSRGLLRLAMIQEGLPDTLGLPAFNR